ncbi:MAG: hypothetical protein KF884_05810 [Fimbriimonadaceae bacterium]|nr:hypothetical protein [Fimbriimonadaceae bacterium]QYK59601.1 MAG: hypothetical protein KF884_05810 [Fimbriimonadaceae bacterium]
MALNKPFENYERPGVVVSYKVSNVKIFKGSFVGVNSSGFLVPMSHATASLKFVGIANESVDNTGGAPGEKSLNVTKTGSFVMKTASAFTPGIADLGKELYCLTDWEVQATTVGLTNSYKIGTMVALETTSTGALGVRVRISNYTV